MSLQLFDLSGRRALVTGSSQGIGRSLAQGLAAAGAAVVLNGRDQAKLARALAALRAEGATVEAEAFDVTDPDAVEAAIARIEEGGPLDILVNNAGTQRRMPLEEFPVETWRELMRTNLDSLFNMSKQVLDGMTERGWGRVVNVSSVNGSKGAFGQTNYSAAKAGVHGFTKALALEVAKKNLADAEVLAPAPHELALGGGVGQPHRPPRSAAGRHLLGVLLHHHRRCPVRERRTGENPHRFDPADRKPARHPDRLLADEPQDGAGCRVEVAHCIAVHGGVCECRDIDLAHHVVGQHRAERVVQRHPKRGLAIYVAQDDL